MKKKKKRVKKNKQKKEFILLACLGFIIVRGRVHVIME